MGMFDIVNVPCPVCKTVLKFQSKGGDCILKEYELNDVPSDVLSDINRHSPYICHSCGTKFAVEVEIIKNIKSVKIS